MHRLRDLTSAVCQVRASGQVRSAPRRAWRMHSLPQIPLSVASSGVTKLRPLRGRRRRGVFTTVTHLSRPASCQDAAWECRHAVRTRSEWPASYSGVRKRVSVQFTFAAAKERGIKKNHAVTVKKMLLLHQPKEKKQYFCKLIP